MLIEATRDVKQLRTEPRMKVLLSGELRTTGGLLPCRLQDISRGGACVEATQPQRVGTPVALNRGNLAVKGTVVWARGRRCGVRFDDPIRATDLFVQLSASRQEQAKPAGSAFEPILAARPAPAASSPLPSR